MNIFVTNYNIDKCASDHCKVHRNKMIVEYAQLMCTAHHVWGSWSSPMYKPTHKNHPSAVWTRTTKGNYSWLYGLWCSLLNEYERDTGKQHKSARLTKELYIDVMEPPKFTKDMLAMPDEYKKDDICLSYRNYLNSKFNEWRNREKPMRIEWNTVPSWYVA